MKVVEGSKEGKKKKEEKKYFVEHPHSTTYFTIPHAVKTQCIPLTALQPPPLCPVRPTPSLPPPPYLAPPSLASCPLPSLAPPMSPSLPPFPSPPYIIHPTPLLHPTSLTPNLTLFFPPPINKFHPQLSTTHSYHTFRSSVQRRIVAVTSELSGR